MKLFIFILTALCPLLLLSVCPASADVVRTPTKDPRITSISLLRTGNLGEGDVIPLDAICPKGKIWYLQNAGIGATNSSIKGGNYREFMMQVVTVNPGGEIGFWLFPVGRSPGFVGGTPVLAVERPLILKSSQTLGARADALASDKQLILLFDGWELPEECLPYLLGLPGLDQMNPMQSSLNREILSLEAQKTSLSK